MDPTDAAHVLTTPEECARFLPRRGETIGLERVIPILVLFKAVERRALVSFEAHRQSFEAADSRVAGMIGEIIADESHHARDVRALLDRWAEEGWGDAVREAERLRDSRALPPA
jgi:hypothetical protein